MKRKLLLLALAFAAGSTSLEATPLLAKFQRANYQYHSSEPDIKVLLVNEHSGITLDVKGRYKVYDARNMQLIGTRFLGKRKFLQATSQGIVWGEGFPGIHQIAIVPDDIRTSIMIDNVEYHGSIFVYDVGGTVSVVNHVNVETYLDLTLMDESLSAMPAEALNAVAIAARTNAYNQLQNSRSPFWDVEASKVGFSIDAQLHTSERVAQAVRATQHMILSKSSKGTGAVTPFPAYWRPAKGGVIVAHGEYSKITLDKAVELANKGEDAAQILQAAFPETKVELVQYAS